MLKVADLKTGKFVKIDDIPFEVLEYFHTKIGRGGAIVKTKLRNLKTGNVIEKTFKGQEKIEEASMSFNSCQFLYSDGEEYFFMDNKTFNQFFLKKDILGASINFLKEGDNINVTFLEKEPMNIDLPIKVDFKVTEAQPGVKGDTASSATKEVEIETGFRLQAPLFIKVGDIIRIDTRNGKYVERVS